jgi:hypothetical protein
MVELQTFILPAGTVYKQNGIPFALAYATQIWCHPDNWELIRDGFTPQTDGQALACSQSEHGLDSPQDAQPCLTSATTSNSSLESSLDFSKSRT